VLTINPAEPTDVTAIADLMAELDQFYGAITTAPVEERVAQINAMLFSETPAAHVLLANDDSGVVGLAAYSFLWPAAGLTHSLFLKELYVRQTCQQRGIGAALMRRLCEIAAKQGCSRVEWQTDITNTDALRFYEALGAPANPGKVCYRLDTDGIAKLLQ
jgi:GNAT superfamily N-acetyltransferase